ncbi:PEP-CTERM sorting domain-containing protein [Paludisphaera mucosa]|uniref:PEP-CTERM sorting domain-containing protein n=1 Tax=Paludisphaera mucosa TaxID=3030827 RepID=A0ABT6FAJ3_9BACT|nr:PEP-CTERM sorting domain-containing protein [Paludisphaera mucosa]MDG3004581.1 PEP-CTERM sorting domain-containing protein [Paludisphaera mucosa]
MGRSFHQARGLAAGLLLAVAAIGWGGLQTARAELIIRDVNVTLNAAAIESYDLDVDGDGTTDFTFTAAFAPDPALTVGFDTVDVPRSNSFNNAVVVDQTTGDGFPTASLLALGDVISSSSLFSFPFDQSNLFFTITIEPATGNFEGRTGFIGLRFDRGNDVLYGFAQITVKPLDDPVDPLGLTIGFVGYNDAAGEAAQIVPEPSSVVLSVLGGLSLLGFARLRRPDRSTVVA